MVITSFIFNVLFFLWMGFVVLFSFVLFLFPKRYFFQWIKLWAKGSVALCRMVGMTFEIRGQEHYQEGCIVACRHESLWETMIFHYLIPKPRFILKKQLAQIPFYGYVLKQLGSIAVDRDKGMRSVSLLMQQTQTALQDGGTLVIFPEGTRMPPDRVGTIKTGVYVLYRAAQRPVVPVMVNSGAFWPRRGFIKRPGRIVLSYLKPIPPGLDKEAFMHHIQQVFEEAHRFYQEQGWTPTRDCA